MSKAPAALRAQTIKRTAKLAFGSKASYSIEELESGKYTQRELRQEYSRLRSIARKRLERLGASEFGGREFVPYNMQMENYPTLAELDANDRRLAIKLRDLATLIESPRSRIYGLEDIREQSVQSMQAQGYDWVTEENWLDFSDFMKTAKAMAGNRMFDSERAAEIFEKASKTKKGTKNKNDLRRAFKAYMAELDAQTAGIPEVKR